MVLLFWWLSRPLSHPDLDCHPALVINQDIIIITRCILKKKMALRTQEIHYKSLSLFSVNSPPGAFLDPIDAAFEGFTWGIGWWMQGYLKKDIQTPTARGRPT
jgi:hypothetical protein